MMTRSLGTHGPRVSAIGLGCGGMSDAYGPADEEISIATIHAALESGITLLDTADFYGMGHNEMLLREALRGRTREQVVISDKFGGLRDPQGRFIGLSEVGSETIRRAQAVHPMMALLDSERDREQN